MEVAQCLTYDGVDVEPRPVGQAAEVHPGALLELGAGEPGADGEDFDVVRGEVHAQGRGDGEAGLDPCAAVRLEEIGD